MVALVEEFICCRDGEISGQNEKYSITWAGSIGLGQYVNA